MKHFKPLWAVCLLFILFGNTVLAFANNSTLPNASICKIEVFTDAAHPVEYNIIPVKCVIQYYKLDQLHQIIAKINKAVVGEQSSVASKKLQQLMHRNQSQLRKDVHGMLLAQKYKIKNVPMIVFDDGVYAIEGQANLQLALQSYQHWLKRDKT